jgi:ADP-ribose pyrophosphatase
MPLIHEQDEEVFPGRFIRVVRRHFRDRDGKPGIWEMVQRRTHGPIVAVVAVTPEHEVIVNRIWRVPLASYVLEFPAGLMDKPGEEPEACAMRELLEETGYVGDHVERLMAGPINAGLTSDQLWVYGCRNARKVAEPAQEPTEDIHVLKVPLRGLMDLLHAPGDGVQVDLKLFGMIPFLQARFPGAFAPA